MQLLKLQLTFFLSSNGALSADGGGGKLLSWLCFGCTAIS